MAAEDVINTAYLSTLGRPADPEGLAFYSAQLEAGRSVGEILAELNLAVESGIENVEANRLASQSEADIRRQVEADVAKFVAARDAGQPTAGIGRPLDRSQFTAPITPEIASDLIGRSQTVGVPNSEFDKYGGYQAVKDVYNASGGTPAAQPRVDPASVQTIDLNLPTRPSVDATNTSLDMPNKQDVSDASGGSYAPPGPSVKREDTFTYTTPGPLTAEEVTSIYRDQFGYDPTSQDLEYWTQVYAMSPDVRYSANPRQQTINAILAGSGLPQYEYLKTGTDLTGTQGVNYKGTPINPTQLANQQAAPFGGFFGDENFNPFDYTGIAPTPGMYRGYDPFATQRAAEINMLGNQYLGGNFEPQGMEFYSTQRSTGRSLADIAADLSASPESQAFAQTRVPSPERAAISSSRPFAARSPTEAAETLRALDPTLRTANLADQGIVAALPGSTASTP
jgi:hypothetical protein